MKARYHEITESPGQRATREQLERLYQRYRFASAHVSGGRVLEVACGAGLGLGFLAGRASSVVGGDIDDSNLEVAGERYRDDRGIRLVKLDAHSLPFPAGSFDVVVLCEAIYYLETPEKFVSEAHRTLGPGGVLFLSTVNSDWRDFHPSRYSTRYLNAPALAALLRRQFPRVELYGAFEADGGGVGAGIFSLMKRTASSLRMIPGSLEARELMKRVFIGKLEPVPAEVFDGMADYREPVPVATDGTAERYKIIYCVARKAEAEDPGTD